MHTPASNIPTTIRLPQPHSPLNPAPHAAASAFVPSDSAAVDPFENLSPSQAAALLAEHLDGHRARRVPRVAWLWSYFRNPPEPWAGPAHRVGVLNAAAGRRLRLAQERGLPARLLVGSTDTDDRWRNREIVIENDIAWRIQAMVDFLFAKPVKLVSTAADATQRERIQAALDAVWEASGGAVLMQDAALIGHVIGSVDLLISATPATISPTPIPVQPAPSPPPAPQHDRAPASPIAGDEAPAADDLAALRRRAAAAVRVHIVEPSRGVAILSPQDYRTLDAFLIDSPPAPGHEGGPETVTLLTGGGWWTLRREPTGVIRPLAEGDNTVCPGRVPVVHIQNISQPFALDGLSEVEPLIPLQDELNTRLSDRASRVTMQSFRMYLAKGFDSLDNLTVAPGMIWSTDNPAATIEPFGGDGASPSEDAHIEQIREALDKASGVPPLATGVVRARVGNLTSENALRLTLQGLLTRTLRKRLTYGRGIAQACEMLLTALDNAGVLPTAPTDRGVLVQWSDPLNRSPEEELRVASARIELGQPRQDVLGELGIAPDQGRIV